MSSPINLLEYEQLAPQHLSPMALDYYAGGACDEQTLRRNRAAYDDFHLLPRVLVDVSTRDLTTTVLRQPVTMPILIAPTAFHCLAHPEGEFATARAAASAGTIFIHSTLATKSLEDVAKASPGLPMWFQLYVHRDRELTRSLVERAETAGFQALCLTVDSPLLGRREKDIRNQFALPPNLCMANFAGVTLGEETGESSLAAYLARQYDTTLTWRDFEWFRSITKLPVVVKGVLRVDDARTAVAHGASAIVVSNHGGRQLDGAIATIDALGPIADTVGSEVEVLMDGGIRRGTDVLKALALGARAVLVGRPILWGLAVAGEAGVRHVLELLRAELDLAMALSGCASLQQIDRSLIIAR